MRLSRPICVLALACALWQARGGDTRSPELKAAQKLDVAKCAKCHRRYQPGDYTQADWERWMDKMGRKSKLKSAQLDLLKRYPSLLAATVGAPAAPPRNKETR